MARKFFSKEAGYEDIKNILQEKLVTYYNQNTKELVHSAVAALALLENKERFVSFSKRVDSIYTIENLNRQKLPTILYGILLLCYKKDFVKQLSDDALVLFSHNMTYLFDGMDSIDQHLTYTTPSILETICIKTSDFMKRDYYYDIAEQLYLQLEKTPKEENEKYICNRIKNMENAEFEVLYKQYCSDEAISEVTIQSGIRI